MDIGEIKASFPTLESINLTIEKEIKTQVLTKLTEIINSIAEHEQLSREKLHKRYLKDFRF